MVELEVMDSHRIRRPDRTPQYGSLDGIARPQSIQPRPAIKIDQLRRPLGSPAPMARPNLRPPQRGDLTMRPLNPLNPPQETPPPSQPTPSTSPKAPSLLSTTLPDLTKLPDQPPVKSKKAHKPWTKKRIAKYAVLSVVLAFLGTGGFLGMKALNTINKVFHGNVISDVTAAFDSTPLKGEDNGRVNILLAGDSADDPGHGGAQLTDSILILSVNTQTHSAFLLSIPRDLWVYIPGLGSWQKINAAVTVSNFNQAGYPSGGMGELEYVIQKDLGIPIDYYGLMDYTAFKDAVDAVGGVTITIQSPDPRGLYDPFTSIKLPNGPVTLNGQQALNLARARGDGYGSYGFPDSDFDRTQHQRQLFIAVAQKAKSLGVLANPVKVSNLIGTLSNNFQTDLSLQNVLRLIQDTKGINPLDVQSFAFSYTASSSNPHPILKSYIDPGTGEDALIPSAGIGNYSDLEQYYLQLTSSNPIVRENPSVVILNGSSVNGLAAKEETGLTAKDFTVSGIGDTSTEYPGTMIIDTTNGGKPNSLKALQQMFPGQTVTSASGSAEAAEGANYNADFIVILGENWNNSSQSGSATAG